MMQPLAIWLTCVCRPTLCIVASNYVPRRLGLCWSRVPGLLPVSAASPSMDHEHGTVCQPILEHQIRPSAPSSVISRPTCFSSSIRCCWQVGSAPFVRRRCDCLASSAPFINIQTYLLTVRLSYRTVSLSVLHTVFVGIFFAAIRTVTKTGTLATAIRPRVSIRDRQCKNLPNA